MDHLPKDELEDMALHGATIPQPTAPAVQIDTQDDDAVIDFVQRRRVSLIQTLGTEDRLPDDFKDRSLYASTLSDLASTAMSKKRLGASERASDLDRQAQMFIATVLGSTGNESPFANQGPVEATEAPELPVTVEGEFQIEDTVLTQGLNTERYDEFTERMEPIMDAERDREEAEIKQ